MKSFLRFVTVMVVFSVLLVLELQLAMAAVSSVVEEESQTQQSIC